MKNTWKERAGPAVGGITALLLGVMAVYCSAAQPARAGERAKNEKASSAETNRWNVLLLIFKRLQAPGRPHVTLHDRDIKHAISVVDRIKRSIPAISNQLMLINNIEAHVIDKPLTSVNADGSLNSSVYGLYDELLRKGRYDQIIAIVPSASFRFADNVLGLGSSYRHAGYAQVALQPGGRYEHRGRKAFPESIFVHEILHYLEMRSKAIKPNTVDLHDAPRFGYPGWNEGYLWRDWFAAYMQNKLEGGVGLDPRVYKVNRAQGK